MANKQQQEQEDRNRLEWFQKMYREWEEKNMLLNGINFTVIAASLTFTN